MPNCFVFFATSVSCHTCTSILWVHRLWHSTPCFIFCFFLHRCYQLGESEKDKALSTGKKIALVATFVQVECQSIKTGAASGVTKKKIAKTSTDTKSKAKKSSEFTAVASKAAKLSDPQDKLEPVNYLEESSLLCLSNEKKKKMPLQDMSNKSGSPTVASTAKKGSKSSSQKKTPTAEKVKKDCTKSSSKIKEVSGKSQDISCYFIKSPPTNSIKSKNLDEHQNKDLNAAGGKKKCDGERNQKRKLKSGKTPEPEKKIAKTATKSSKFTKSLEKAKTLLKETSQKLETCNSNEEVDNIGRTSTLSENTSISSPSLACTSEAGLMQELNEKTPLEVSFVQF